MPKNALDRFTDRVLALLGLDMDFSLPSSDSERVSAITQTLLLGARPTPDDVPSLRDAGVTHVVSCLEDSRRRDVDFLARDFRALFLPARDSVHTDLAPMFDRFFSFADEAHEDPEARLLVHCEVGVSRSATLVVARHMRAERLRFLEAYHAVRARRAKILPNISFASQLQRLERQLDLDEPREDGHSSLTRYLRDVCNVPVEADLLEDMLERHDFDALRAITAIFGEVPRVVQGARR